VVDLDTEGDKSQSFRDNLSGKKTGVKEIYFPPVLFILIRRYSGDEGDHFLR
jgi:hypothetical protein